MEQRFTNPAATDHLRPATDEVGSERAASSTSFQTIPAAPPRLCSHCKTEPVRGSNQHYCKACHAAASKSYRERTKRELARFKQAHQEMTVENTHTRMEFEKRYGTSRHVIVVRDIDSIEDSGEVVRFLPDEKVEVRSASSRKLRIVPLDLIRPDRDYVEVGPFKEQTLEEIVAEVEQARAEAPKGHWPPDSAYTAERRRIMRRLRKTKQRRRGSCRGLSAQA